MLFPAPFWPGLADGSITVAFRRQKRATVKAGGTLRSPGGVLFIDAVEPISEYDITDADARAAGHADRAEAIAALRPEGMLYRIRFHLEGDDPRVALREDTGDLAAVRAKVDRFPWAVPILALIRDNEGVVSTELAPQLGMERLPFKQKVRRLKELGLTESLKVGYRLSPRGEAFLGSVVADD
ncbi:MAG TPA: hypothetical protein VHD87_04970 [Acidimicrobiales bacterium]|nr:hypothetical protein [Acidimicrobiales bacterium]